jgi:cytoskeleton protein RodZ
VLQNADDVSLELVAEVPQRLMAPEAPAEGPSVTVAEAPAEAEDAPGAADTVAAMEDVALAPADEVAPDPLPQAAADEAAPEPAPQAEALAATTEEPVTPTGELSAPAEGPVGAADAPVAAPAPEPIEDIIDQTIAAAPPEPEVTPASEPLAGAAPGGSDTQPGASQTITGALAAAPDAPDLIEDPPPPPVAPSAEYEPRVYGQVNTDARVVLRARSDTWVQVQGADNDLLLTRILRPGDVFRVPNRGDLTLVTGNAGGLEVLVDGELMPPLGAEGAVRRDISLSPEALTSGPAVGQR